MLRLKIRCHLRKREVRFLTWLSEHAGCMLGTAVCILVESCWTTQLGSIFFSPWLEASLCTISLSFQSQPKIYANNARWLECIILIEVTRILTIHPQNWSGCEGDSSHRGALGGSWVGSSIWRCVDFLVGATACSWYSGCRRVLLFFEWLVIKRPPPRTDMAAESAGFVLGKVVNIRWKPWRHSAATRRKLPHLDENCALSSSLFLEPVPVVRRWHASLPWFRRIPFANRWLAIWSYRTD